MTARRRGWSLRGFTRIQAFRAGIKDPLIRILLLAAASLFIVVLLSTLWTLVNVIAAPLPARTAPEQRVRMLKSVIEESPEVAKAWADYARALMAADRFAAANAALKAGADAVGEDAPEILLEQGRLASLQGESELALELLDKARASALKFRDKELKRLSKASVHPDPRVIKGDIVNTAAVLSGDLYGRAGEWKKALEQYQAALSEMPDDSDVLFKRGAVYMELEEYEKAAADFERVLLFNPQMIQAHRALAKAESELGK